MEKKMKKVTLGLVTTVLATMIGNGFAADVFNTEQQQAIEKIVQNYIDQHPEALAVAQQALQKKMMEQRVAKNVEAAKQIAPDLFKAEHNIVLGNPKGKITLVEFFDYYCGHCRNMEKTFTSLVKANPDLRIVQKVTPIFGEKSNTIAALAVAADMQGKLLVWNKALMDSNNAAKTDTKEHLLELAKATGLDSVQLEKDMASDVVKTTIANDLKLANSVSGNAIGTPLMIIGRTDGKTSLEKLKYFPGEVDFDTLQDAVNDLK
jgi:protein-disulfide isomerase